MVTAPAFGMTINWLPSLDSNHHSPLCIEIGPILTMVSSLIDRVNGSWKLNDLVGFISQKDLNLIAVIPLHNLTPYRWFGVALE